MLSPATTTSSRIETIESEAKPKPEQQKPQRGSSTAKVVGGARLSCAIPGILVLHRPQSEREKEQEQEEELETKLKPKSQGNREQFSIATARELARPGSEAGLRHGLLAKYPARPLLRLRRWPDGRTRIPTAGRL